MRLVIAPPRDRWGGTSSEQGRSRSPRSATRCSATRPSFPSDPGSYLRRVAGQLRGDVVFGNLEGTLTDVSGSPKCGAALRRLLRLPHAAALRPLPAPRRLHGDERRQQPLPRLRRRRGEADTVRALHRAGIAQTGRPGKITVRRGRGRSRSPSSASPPTLNTGSLTRPAGRPPADPPRRPAGGDRRRARSTPGPRASGAQHVTGREENYLGEDRGNPERFAQMAIRAGADLVLGSGPHVLRGMQIYRHRLIAYSLGNFAGFHNFDTRGALGASAILHVSLDARRRASVPAGSPRSAWPARDSRSSTRPSRRPPDRPPLPPGLRPQRRPGRRPRKAAGPVSIDDP